MNISHNINDILFVIIERKVSKRKIVKIVIEELRVSYSMHKVNESDTTYPWMIFTDESRFFKTEDEAKVKLIKDILKD